MQEKAGVPLLFRMFFRPIVDSRPNDHNENLSKHRIQYQDEEGGLHLKIIPHYPTSVTGMKALAEQIAAVQASFVCEQLKKLNCPKEQKLQLLNAVLAESKKVGQ